MVRVRLLPEGSPEFGAVVHEGVFVPSVFYLADGGDTSAAFAAYVRTLPRFELGPRDRAIPRELASLPSDAEVIYRNGGGDTIGKAGEVARDMQRTISRRLGPHGERISWLDIAEALLEASGQRPEAVPKSSKDALHDRVRQAVSSGALRVRHPETDLSEVYADWPQPSDGCLVCSIDDVNEWLATDGVGYRLSELPTQVLGAQDDAGLVGERVDYGSLATREALVRVFGTHTRMNLDWFNNLSDSPGLKKACKVRGKGGKPGSQVEPMFCPYEVMLWLTDPKTKKQGLVRMSEQTGWRLLKQSFKAAYIKVGHGDPNQSD